jgi:uncharacterized protein
VQQIVIEDSYKRLLNPAISNEALQEAKACATNSGFANNLQLLPGTAIGRKAYLAIDPGFRSGCKVVCLDEKEIYYTTKIFIPHAKTKLLWR